MLLMGPSTLPGVCRRWKNFVLLLRAGIPSGISVGKGLMLLLRRWSNGGSATVTSSIRRIVVVRVDRCLISLMIVSVSGVSSVHMLVETEGISFLWKGLASRSWPTIVGVTIRRRVVSRRRRVAFHFADMCLVVEL